MEARGLPILLGAASCALPLIICASRLNLNLWYDEAYTLEAYASRGPLYVVTNYENPNNHILYSLILCALRAFSENDIWLRLPNLVFAAVALFSVYRAGAILVCPGAGAAASAAMGMSVVYLIHAMQLRGYGLSIALSAILLNFCIRRTVAIGAIVRSAIIVLVAAMIYTVPSNVFTAVGLAAASVFIVWRRTRQLKPVTMEAVNWAAGGILAVLLYLPVLGSLQKNRAALEAGPTAFVSCYRFFEMFLRDIRWVAVLIPLGLAVFFACARRRDSTEGMGEVRILPRSQPVRQGTNATVQYGGAKRIEIALTLVLACAGPFLAQTIVGLRIPFNRAYCPNLPGAAILLGWLWRETLFGALACLMPRKRTYAEWLAPLTITIVFAPAVFTYPARLASYRDRAFAQDGYYLYFAADYHPDRIVQYLRESVSPDESYRLLWDRFGNVVFPHYCLAAGFAPSRMRPGESPDRLNIYYAAPVLARYDDITAVSGIPEAILRQFYRVSDFGYFHLYQIRGDELNRLMPLDGR